MPTLLSIIIFVTVFIITLFTISLIKKWEYTCFFTAFLGVMTLLILWIPVGFETTVKMEIKPIKCEVVKTSRIVVVDDGEKMWEFNDHQSYKEINDSTIFLKTLHYNMYGDVCGIDLNYKK